jgi:hypothetical protein
MGNPHIQTSFASGELAPKLRSRVDVAKYHTGAAMLRNFFVDYSAGGASTRQGTKWCLKTKSLGARLINFQPSTSLSYVLEFGQNYIRFYSNGAPILETAVTGGSAASGNTFTITNTFVIGDWVLANNWGGLTNVNGNYYIISSASGSTISVTDLFGNAVTFTGAYTSGGQLQRVYTLASPYSAADLFPNPATANPGLKFVQDVTSLIITHPNYAPQILTIASATSWSIATINFNPTISPPTGLTSTGTTLSTGGNWDYGLVVTSVDINGQESVPSTVQSYLNYDFMGGAAGAIVLNWTAVSGAVSYNVYACAPLYNFGSIPTGTQFGFLGNATGVTFYWSNEASPQPDFSQTPPIAQNPFSGTGVQSFTQTASGSYSTVPGVIVAAPSSGVTATAIASVGGLTVAIAAHAPSNLDIQSSNGSSPVGNCILTPGNGLIIAITAATNVIGNDWEITGIQLLVPGSWTGAGTSLPTTMAAGTNLSPQPGNVFTLNSGFQITGTFGVLQTLPVQQGSGYTTVPAVTYSSGAATATAVLGTASAGNPGVPGFFQQRLMLANQQKAVQTYNLSQPSSFFNFNISNPSEDDDAINGTIISEELNDIRCLVPVPTGVLAGTGRGAWLINAGGGLSVNNPITPSNQVAAPQAFNGFNDLKPIKINFDVLYGTNKGNYVRDLSYNIYAAIFSGSDISVWSNHLFFGYYIVDWAWAEEPFKTLWGVRSDGTLLSLAYVKEQELVGWAHHDTNGQFTSVCSVIETVGNGNVVDAIYVIVQRVINGTTVQYVERMADRYFTHGYVDSWSVDCALQTTANSKPANALTITGNVSVTGNVVTLGDATDAPFTSAMATNNWLVHTNDGGIYKITAFTSTSQVTATVSRIPNFFNQYTNSAFTSPGGLWALWQPTSTVSGLQQLVGQSVYGVADGATVGPLTVSATGSVTLPTAASKITLGLQYLPQLQSLPLEPASQRGTTQSKRKKFPDITLRVADTLGLQVGTSFPLAVTVKDFQIGAIPTLSTGPSLVTDLINPSMGPNAQTTDGFQINDPLWQEAGQLCIQQNLPYPATILGIIPEVTLGDEP